jgi:phenolic acid decarboxylase
VDILNVSYRQVEDMGRVGYTQGITNIILDELNKLDITKRPIHCTDLKRQTLYVKENNEWHKDTAEDLLLNVVVNKTTKKNLVKFLEWVTMDPRRTQPGTKEYDNHIAIMNNCVNTKDKNNLNDYKILANIAKSVYLDKATKDKFLKNSMRPLTEVSEITNDV